MAPASMQPIDWALIGTANKGSMIGGKSASAAVKAAKRAM